MTGPHSHDHLGVAAHHRKRVLWIALALNGTFFFVEVAGGIVFDSLALLADAGHMFSDSGGLVIALIAQSLMERPASGKHTYGLQRAEVLGALANSVVLFGAVGWIGYEGIQRLLDPQEIAGGGLLVVATLGLAVNVISAYYLHGARGESLNMHGAFVHMVADALGSVAVIVAALAVIVWDATWVDPLASMAIAGSILYGSWGLLRDTVHVLMEGTPRGLDAAAVEDAISTHDLVDSVHHVHLWNISSEVPALSAHVVLTGEPTLHEAQLQGDIIKSMLHDRFGIEHATLELECHDCEVHPVR